MKDTATISISEYNALRDFKKFIEDGKYVKINYGEYYVQDEKIYSAEIVDINKEFEKANLELRDKNKILRDQLIYLRDSSVFNFKNWRSVNKYTIF